MTPTVRVCHLPLLRPDLAPDVQSVGFVYHVPQRDDDTGMGIFRGGGVEVFIDRNEADTTDAEILLDVIAGVNGVSPQTGEVFLCQVGTKKILRFYKPFIGGQPPVNGLLHLY